jgi:hypothetical protein
MNREEFTIDQIRAFVAKGYNSVAARYVKAALCHIDRLSLPPAEGAEDIRQLLLGWEHYKRDHLRESEALDVEAILLSEYSQIAAQPQPTAEGTGKTCHAKEMEYNHNMCAMQESCEKCEAYKVPTNEGDIAKTETDTGRIVDMPSLSLPPAEGAEEILEDIAMRIDASGVGNNRDAIKRFYRDKLNTLATLHAQRIAEKMVSERLREELIRYIKWYGGFNYENMTDEMLVNEYLKTRDSHESV